MKVVIVGGGAGGMSTASNIRRLDKDAEITVITRDENVAYSPCAIPYVLSGKISSFDDIIMKTPEDYKEVNIDVLIKSEVTAVDSSKKTVTYENADGEKTIDYDKLVLATGGNPFVPPMEGVDLEGVFQIRNIEDGRKVQQWAKTSKSAVVTGAGLIGIEIVFALKELGLNVTLSEMMPQIVPRSLDSDMADILTRYLKMENIHVMLGEPITKLEGEGGKVKKAYFGDGSCIDADMVILATGVRPELELAKMAGCDIGRWAILVNEKMETSVEDVYALGDCVESQDLILQANTISHLGTTAVRESKTLARTITGKKSNFNPVLNAMVSKVGKLEFGAVGLTSSFAQQNNIKPIVEKVEALTRARYYPNAKPMDIKIICDCNGRIIGCQIIAEERVAERIDTMTLAITQGLSCFELSNVEFAYAPPVSMVTDPLVLAVEEVSKKFN
ncbi:FAD-dependent oxidoreductase [Methanobrevibacter sp. TLL-48-HuF1]|jgi:NADH oxidase (H2O2-forming)|uniref:FAD-dependent oxidoreductase n=1 Tax=Methanobrevibacter TaxID=2172 RepID=UPI00036194DC|nr:MULTISPECIES: FAD-dependent oxidoreductase [Methanobrevibacter]URN49541.1 FAD-dependent oxidoreductase [Methanobrevibacter sp. TLL-48-HuF1]